jgi:luciferase family oxidoreductase group 1
MMPPLSVLDQSTIASGRSGAEAIRETLALAQACEGFGYRRYWLAEHHASGSHAGTAPEVLMAAIAATTSRIRVGSAGVMLPHYSALKVAEQFRVLEAIAPGRVDCGVGRAPGADMRTAFALNPLAREAAERFPAQVQELLGWLGEGLPVDHPFASIRAMPDTPGAPQVWILGSSDFGAQLAAHFGLPYCFAHFITEGEGAAEALALYRARFRPDAGRLARPHAAVAVFALAAGTEAEALRLYRSRELWRVRRSRGLFAPLPSPEEAEAHPWTEAERAQAERGRARALVGAAEHVAARITGLAAELGADEVAVLTPCHDAAARRDSYRLLAEAARALPAAA